MNLSVKHVKLIEECLDWYEQQAEPNGWAKKWREAFTQMRDRDRPLSPLQEQYLLGVAEKIDVDVDEPLLAKNVPVGEHLRTPIPEVLLRPLPKRPPGR